jgi:fatty-acyl-CoA synthase
MTLTSIYQWYNRKSKGATLSHHNILNNGYIAAKTQRITEEDKIVIPVPLYHCFGMVLGI